MKARRTILHTLLVAAIFVAIHPFVRAGDFKAGDEVQITRAAPLTFNGKTYRDATIGDRFKVLAYRPAEKRVYLGLRDSEGKDFAVAVEEDAVEFVRAAVNRAPTDAKAIGNTSAMDDRVMAAKVAAEVARLRKNAAAIDHPNRLFPNDTSNEERAAQLRAQADALEQQAKKYAAAAKKGAESVVAKPPISAVPAPTPVESSSKVLSAATKENPFVNSLGMKFVPVPITGGPMDGKDVLFSVWDTRKQDYTRFWLESRLVENLHLSTTWQAAEYKGEKYGLTYPVVGLRWEEAKAFCVWLTKRERASGKIGRGVEYRLPTDHEWSCAAGIGDREDANALPCSKNEKLPGAYPWGSA